MSTFAAKRLVVGVTGGIAAYKAADLVSKLAQAGAEVRVVMTAHATEFVGPTTFQALSGNPVYTATFAAPEAYGMGHLSLASADAVVVAPATANLLGKAAAGLADDLLTTTLLAVTCPVLLAPAMNQAMWHHPLVQRNVATLQDAGYQFVGPSSGWLACRQQGDGRMADVPNIVAALEALLFAERDLTGRRVLITAGPTREPLDAVRFVSNPSSGRQGYALARAAALHGATVTLVSGPTELPAPPGVERVSVNTAAEMAAAVLARWPEADVFVGAAAVADYAPADPDPRKRAKAGDTISIALHRTPDIIAAVAAQRRPGQVVVGFAAQTHEVIERAQEKLQRKGLDLMVANDVSQPGRGFGGDDNQVTLLHADGRREDLPSLSKLDVGHEVLRRVAALL